MSLKSRVFKTAIALTLGLAGAVAIWIVAPYNTLIINNASITDSYLPGIVLLITMLLVVGINPMLRLFGLTPLSTRQMALAVGLMLMASVVPTGGAFNGLVLAVARTPMTVQRDGALQRQYESMRLPESLFVDSPTGSETPAGEGYVSGLHSGEEVPWSAWAGPLFAWGAFLLFAWMMMIGLSMVVFPQWRNNERLAFPLLAVQQSLIEAPESGRTFPPLLRTRSFWVAVAAVMVIYAFYGLSMHMPDTVPTLPIDFDFSALYRESPWHMVATYIRRGRIFFLLIGMAFFMPTRISFSIWFFLVLNGFYRGFAPLFGDNDFITKANDVRFGAVITLTVCVLWIGRSHWAAVFGSMFRRGGSPIEKRNRVSGWVFVVGIIGMFVWLMWVGWGHIASSAEPTTALARHAGWSVVLVAFVFMISLLISRIVAETGMPFIRLYEQPLVLMQMAPVAWVGAVSLLMAGVMDMLISNGSRVNPGTMSMHVIGLDEAVSPQRQSRLGIALIGIVAAGIVITGMSNVSASYNNASTWNNLPVHDGGLDYLAEANNSVKELARRTDMTGPLDREAYNRPAHFAVGAAAAVILYYLCLAIPQWPIHPFGLMLINSHYGQTAWPSILIGWLFQIIIVKYGGARLYRRARPFFLGLIIGEVLAGAVWALAPILLTALDLTYVPVHILPQ